MVLCIHPVSRWPTRGGEYERSAPGEQAGLKEVGTHREMHSTHRRAAARLDEDVELARVAN